MEFGPFPLIELERIEVPTVAVFPHGNGVPAELYAQDTKSARSALSAVGKQLPLEDTATGLRIVGHVL